MVPELAGIADRNDEKKVLRLSRWPEKQPSANCSASWQAIIRFAKFPWNEIPGKDLPATEGEDFMSKAIDTLKTAMQKAAAIRPKVGGFPYLAETLRQAESPAIPGRFPRAKAYS